MEATPGRRSMRKAKRPKGMWRLVEISGASVLHRKR
jgi:hypothetical protein